MIEREEEVYEVEVERELLFLMNLKSRRSKAFLGHILSDISMAD